MRRSYRNARVSSFAIALFLAVLLLPDILVSGARAGTDPVIHFGGALRFNYYVKSWAGQEANRKKGGDFSLDTFRIEADGSYEDLIISAEYRFYQGYHMLHHGYMGWKPSDRTTYMLCVSQVPFGIQPYASHNWFFDVGYYVGLEDDYDLGLQSVTRGEAWDLKLAFFKNSEGNYTGRSMDSARYSYDVVNAELPVPGGPAGSTVVRRNEEVNQFNGRYAYTFGQGTDASTEVGVSAQYGFLYDADTASMGHHQAFAVHAVGNYGKFNVMAEGATYKYSLDLPAGDPVGGDLVAYGAYDAPYWIASEGNIYLFNVAWASGWSLGPFESLTFYNDYSYLDKKNAAFEDTQQNVLGMAGAAGPLYCYFDVAMGRNHPWLGGSWSYGLAQGSPDANWETRYNINFGYYF